MDKPEIPKKLKAYIIAHLRRIGYRNVHRAKAFQEAHIGRAQWKCKNCEKIFSSSKELHGDHIIPVVDPNKGFTTWDEYITKLFLGEIQALCVECHKQKSGGENVIRREEQKWENID